MKTRLIRPLVWLATLAIAMPLFAADPLPSDARILSGKLANGVTWKYRKHDNPPGRMALMMHVASGSLNETEEQRGLAHFLEHMAFNGSEHFAPGELVPYFERIGMQFGPDLNAFTGFDQTAYMLFLPDATEPQVADALKVLSDYAFRLLLLPAEIDRERGVVLSELRAGMSAQQRIRDEFIERVFAGSHLSQRLPIGKREVIENADRDRFEAYYRTWYRPQNITVILVGDAEPEPYLPLLEKWFGQYEATVAAADQARPGLRPFETERAFIITDPEHAQGNVDLYALHPGRQPTTTIAQARVELVDRLALWMLNRRLSQRVQRGEAAYRTAQVSVGDFLNDAVLVSGSATGEPDAWEKMLAEVILEISRAREHGFLPGEFDLCQREVLSGAEDAVRKEPTQNARGLLFRILAGVNTREPVLSAEQELDVLQKLLPTITLEELNAAFAAHYSPQAFAYVVTLPEKDGIKLPAEDEVLAAARAAFARSTVQVADVAAADSLLAQPPVPGKVTETSRDEDLQIVSGWLSNGVRFHYRFMDYKKDLVLVSFALAGGQIEETSANAGITLFASRLFAQPATDRLDSSALQDLMTGRNIAIGAAPANDHLRVTLRGSPQDLEFGLQLAHALLISGKLEQSAYDNTRQQILQQFAMARRMPQFVALETFVKAVSGGDPRRILLPAVEQVEALTLEAAQQWFHRIARTAPLEVTIVGEVPLDTVLPLLETYVASLGERPRTAEHLEPLRTLRDRGPGPLVRHVRVDTITPQGFALTGFVAADAQNIADVRALNLAQNTLDSRLIKRVREELALVYSISASHSPDPVYHDAGSFLSGAPCDPAKTDEVVTEVEKIFTAFAADGPSAEELATALRQTLNSLDQQLKEPSFWFDRLSAFDLHKGRLEDLKNIPAAYEAITAEQVRDTFRKYYTSARQFRVTAVPETAATPAEPKAELEPAPAD